MESKIETPVDIVEVKIAENNDTNQTVEVVKKKRGRPRKHPPPEPKPPTEDGDEPKEPKKRGRPKKTEQLPKPIKIPKKRGRRRIYAEGTIGKPKDPEYFKNYYKNITLTKRLAKKLNEIKNEQIVNNK